ncbi:MAG: hydroxyacid dehydrogenase [Rhizobiales bacterium 65-9]|nr:MAG: hydroxyacid dehydrogenase [Rhizobiales bacterium 65-9]
MRIHVENDPASAEALKLTPERLNDALAARPDLRVNTVFSFNDAPARFADLARDAEIVFAGRKVNALGLPNLKWLQSISAGVESMLPYLPPAAILTNASGVHGDKAAEFILASVLMLNFQIPRFVSDQQRQLWRPEFGGCLSGKVATLLGAGAIGSAAARLLRERGMRIQAITRSGGPREHVDVSKTVDEKDSLLPQTDFLIASAPLTPETKGMIDRRRLDLLPPRAGVVIVGRAGVFDCGALVDKLKDGTLSGAVLDVFPIEPLPQDHPIWTAPNLIMTPHCSVDDHSVYLDRCLDIFLDNLARYVSGRPLRNVVDRAAGY